jgi:nucleoside-diphosphate-sugar epimerase
VLSAALDGGVERVVMTSSVAAVRGSRPVTDATPLTEDDWTDGNDTSKSPYVRSKATAERAAWDHVDAAGARDRLAVINPGAIIGPVTSDDRSFSLQMIERLFSGPPIVPRLGFSVVDVRDVAEMHVLAMTEPAAGGERFIATDEFLWFKDVADILRDRLGERARKVPTRVAPDALIKVVALFDPSAKSIVSDLGKKSVYSNEKARTVLGWEPRPAGDSIVDTAESLFEHGVVKPA